MKLIVDSGATKALWALVGDDGKLSATTATGGINLATMPAERVDALVSEAAAAMNAEKVEAIWFYAAGLVSGGAAEASAPEVPELARDLDRTFRRFFPGAQCFYASDLLAAARAVCGRSKGIAAILGTGSNSCMYDGSAIVRNIHSCGFILGDEGSAASLGKKFMAAFLKELLPEDVSGDFANRFEVDYLTVVKNVYRSAAPSGYLGSFAPYILSLYGKNDYVTALVEDNFRDFIKTFILRYDPSRKLPVGVVGGFAYACRDILLKVAAQEGVNISEILPSPLEGLVKYHASF